ncbi:hypothetical protein HBO37_20645 [Pseudomonas proteolytica]|uniref:hypothetical protein n=1 Tax=Pseudomonas proteolytica TaxID=219574 RepID=UPI001473A3F3|nr:hypothetical protein [Pseudomonas proteolytica]MDZ4302276.1 hypothetical protein [Pseudomonas sp.]NMZ07764.1 hypothetical protein [Pseudomonas proteolytica]
MPTDNLVKPLIIAISELDQRLLASGISGWRSANGDIDTAINSENWCAIAGAQHSRALHANTIALIFHKYTDVTPDQGVYS